LDILKHVEDSGHFSRDAVTMMYGHDVPTKKINRKEYGDKIRKAHLHSKVSIAAALLAEHKRNPYASVNDILGDFQVILTDSWAEFRRLEPKHRMIDIEDLLDVEVTSQQEVS
jgi:hypothetical protein